jgi:hypothetical protein
MPIIGFDLHARQQTLAMLDTTTGEFVNTTLLHEGDSVQEFYSKLPHPVRVGIEATGSMHWFLNLTGEPSLKAGSSNNSSWAARIEEMLGGQHRSDEVTRG